MPAIRGMISHDHHMVGHFDDQPAVLEFVNANGMEPLAALGTSCPDHFLRTKIRPLVVGFDPANPDVLSDTIVNIACYASAFCGCCQLCHLFHQANIVQFHRDGRGLGQAYPTSIQ